jgi:Mrp family chromosome partitioning ATPase
MSLRQGMRVLGMLPSLPRNLEDPGAASFAALCVHHIRMLLQVMPRMDSHPVIAVTSPSPGDGKTSLTLALALSFAASGKSTLLIDCDIVGAGLTRRVNAIIRRRIGQILIRENLITPAQLREALNLAQRTGRKLGEVLVDEGYVEQEQVTRALTMQAETSVGLLDVMRGEVLEECVADTGMARLWILPVGSALAEHGATISPEGFRTVLEQARKRFDVVLVDTGPVPGSIESSVAASQSDGVVLCVSRGEQGPLVRRASEHLHDIGSRALGLVFNRATPEDFSSSYGAMSSPSIPARIPEKQGADRATFGPVASAVAGTQVKKG